MLIRPPLRPAMRAALYSPLFGKWGGGGVAYIGINYSNLAFAWVQEGPSDELIEWWASIGVTVVRLGTALERWLWNAGSGAPVLGDTINVDYALLVKTTIQRLWTVGGIKAIPGFHNYNRLDPDYDPVAGSPSGTYNHGNPGGEGTPGATPYVLVSEDFTLAHIVDVTEQVATYLEGCSPGYCGFYLMNEPHDSLGVNLINNGNSLNGANWFTTNGAAVTQGYPDAYGGNTAWRLTSGTGFGTVTRGGNTLETAQYTLSFMARSLSGAQPVKGNYEFGDTSSPQQNATTTWQRFSFLINATAGSGRNVGVQLNAASGNTVEISHVQLELGDQTTELGAGSVAQGIMQAQVNAFRSVDTDVHLVVCGDQYSVAGKWTTDSNDLRVTDSAGKLVYDAHNYGGPIDNHHDYSDDYDTIGATPTQGAERIDNFGGWLTGLSFKGMIGEMGVPANQIQAGDGAKWVVWLENAIDAAQAYGMPVFYHESITHNDSDPAWWPGSDQILNIQPDDADQSRAHLLRSKAKAGPFVWPT